jgi:hypothetical protein
VDFDLENVVGARGMLIESVVAKNALTRRNPNMIQELFNIFDFFPRLPLYYHPVFDSYQLHLLIAALFPIQVFNVITIYLNR